MPRHSRGRRAASDGFDSDPDPDLFFSDSESERKRSTRKDAQLCAQVQRAIEDALSGELDDAVLADLWVVRVEPAPNVAHLRVWVAPARRDAAQSPEVVLAHLAAAAGLLRAEVAAAIHRKRVPELSFALWSEELAP